MWALTHHDVLKQALGSPQTFVRGWENWRALHAGEVDVSNPMVTILIGVRSMLTSNDPDHKRLRKILQGKLTARRVQGLQPRVADLTATLLDEMAAAEPPVDLKAAFARPLPIQVICELLGLPTAEAPRLAEITERTLSGLDAQANGSAYPYIDAVIEEKRAHPDGGLISDLVQAHDEQGLLSQRELADNVFLLIVAGFETTMGAICNGVRALLTHPEQYALVRDGHVPWSQAVEEILRYDTSVALLPVLYTTTDVDIGGQHIPAGEPVLMAYAAANRDPRAYTNADVFDVTRRPQHLAFGHGVHNCLGSSLARLELNVALPALFDRFCDLNLALPDRELPQTPTLLMNHPRTLPVRFTSTPT